ncbi:MAG: inositol monophosphatase [Patescibacteria group bacterium]
MEYQQFIEHSLHQASEIASKEFGRVSGTIKDEDNNQILTETDTRIGRLLVNLIQGEFPEHNIIDEETGVVDNNSQFTWVIDPIDGTSNFVQGVPNYGIMIGLLRGGEPISAGISLPFFQEIILAEKGQGTFRKNERLRVTEERDLSSVLVAYQLDSHQNDPDFTRREYTTVAEIALAVRNVRTSGSCFDAVMVAEGKYGACLNRTAKIWDIVAAQLIVEEAGGVCTDFFGRDLDYVDPVSRVANNFTYCLASPILHEQIQKIIRRIH